MTDVTRNARNAALTALRTRSSSAQRSGFAPRDLDDDKLKGLNHAEWLEDFSKILALQTGVQMSPKREGTITRLHWASLYVRLLEQTVRDHEVEIQKLKKQLEDTAQSESEP
jgi:hypothetical protein